MDIIGTWTYKTINRDSIIKPLKTLYPTSYPEIENLYDVIYIDSEKIEHPLLRTNNDFTMQDKFIYYKLDGDKIVFHRDSAKYEYDINVTGNKLCFNHGKFCLTKNISKQNSIDSTIFRFSIKQEFGPNYEFWMNYNYLSDGSICEIRYDECPDEIDSDTIYLSEEIKSYIVTMLERIPGNQLDRIYNNGLSDCIEISLDFYTAGGRWKGIETCGLANQNPFEIRV